MLRPEYQELVNLRKPKKSMDLLSKAKVRSDAMGGHTSPFKGRGLDFAEVREYAMGDDIRSIDWRVTARMGRTHTKVFTEERERIVYVIVDLNRYMEFGTRRTFKSVQAARAAATLAWRANDLQDRTGAILFGQVPERVRVFPAKRSRKSIWEMLKVLCAEGAGDAEVRIEEALATANDRIPSGACVFIISDFLGIGPEFESQLGLLAKGRDVTLVRVSDPADRSIPPAGEIRFSDGGESRLVVDTEDPNGGERYRNLWNESDVALRAAADRFRSKIVELGTEREVNLDLFYANNPRAGRRIA